MAVTIKAVFQALRVAMRKSDENSIGTGDIFKHDTSNAMISCLVVNARDMLSEGWCLSFL